MAIVSIHVDFKRKQGWFWESVSLSKQREEESGLEGKYLAFLLFRKAGGEVKGWHLEV